MTSEDWLADTRVSYDTVAQSYADLVRHLLDDAPYEQSAFALFAGLVRAAGGGPVADVGCGPGRVTAYLRNLGVDAFGVDLSPGMIEVARRENPGVRFEVGSMTDLRLAAGGTAAGETADGEMADGAVAGLIAWYSLIHIPDDEIGTVLAQFHRVLRPGGPLLLGFHAGDGSRLKTEGYGGHPMHIYVHRREPETVAAWLEKAGFTVEAQTILHSPESRRAAMVFARRR